MALKEALSAVYWYKGDLRRFLSACLSDSAIVATLNWDGYKREIVGELVDRLQKNELQNQDVLLHLMLEVSSVNDFSHLTKLENGQEKAKKAKDAVAALKQQTKGLGELFNNREDVTKKRQEYKSNQEKLDDVREKLAAIRKEYLELLMSTGPQKRGFQLEKILRNLFEIHDLDPRGSFKVTGEQIDGAFTFDSIDYLLEAKWEKKPIGSSDLYAFQGKVSRRLDNTLGLYISINGYSQDGLEAFMNSRPNLFLLDGADLAAVLENRIDLKNLLTRKRKEASQTGNIYLKVNEIL